MTFQLIRKDGKVRGVALLLGDARVIPADDSQRELWRICECCHVNEALVYCCTHARYVCASCLEQLPSVHTGCRFISMAVARDLAEQAFRTEVRVMEATRLP